jgi:hypothetical protein
MYRLEVVSVYGMTVFKWSLRNKVGVELIDLAYVTNRWSAFVNTLMNIQI